MLSFTLNEKGNYLGTYNGRFVFHVPSGDEISSTNYLHLIKHGKHEALKKSVFSHEFFHWLAFRSSSFGISTIGRRYRARTEFLFGNELEVKNYYKQRTAYFCCSYNAHEEIVDQLCKKYSDRDTKSLKKIKLEKSQITQISNSDKEAKKSTIDLGVEQSISKSMADYIKGLRASSELGFQVYIKNSEDKIDLHEVSLKSMTFGIFNAAFEKNLGPQNFIITYLKKLRREFNREKRIGGFDKQKMARWAVIKFSTEAETLRELKELDYPTPFSFEKYCTDISSFAHRHTLNTDKIMEANLATMIHSCGEHDKNQEDYNNLIHMFEYIDESILYFFYVHGN